MDNQHEITQADVVAALEDIAEADPELMEYILTCYPPELMLYMSPEICQRLEASKRSLSPQEKDDS